MGDPMLRVLTFPGDEDDSLAHDSIVPKPNISRDKLIGR
jgi:hypothetical protein